MRGAEYLEGSKTIRDMDDDHIFTKYASFLTISYWHINYGIM